MNRFPGWSRVFLISFSALTVFVVLFADYSLTGLHSVGLVTGRPSGL